MNTLLAKAISTQKSRELNDAQFADWLKVPRTVWRLARTEERPITITLLKAFARLPGSDFDPYILAFLRDGQPPLPGCNAAGSQPPAAPLPAGEQSVPTGRVQP